MDLSKPVYYKLTTRITPSVGGSINQNFHATYTAHHPLTRFYWKGATVTAWKSTPGIFFFKTIKDAAKFVTRTMAQEIAVSDTILFMVQPIGKVKKVKKIFYWSFLEALVTWRLFTVRKATEKHYAQAPCGTMAAPAVKVVDQMSDEAWQEHCRRCA
jgi:hypothetical protein